jgi:hypothetical protein
MIYNYKMPAPLHQDRYWSRTIQLSATDKGVEEVTNALNTTLLDKRCTKVDIMVACAQALGQLIVPAGTDIADVMRRGVIALIDGYSMEAATQDDA